MQTFFRKILTLFISCVFIACGSDATVSKSQTDGVGLQETNDTSQETMLVSDGSSDITLVTQADTVPMQGQYNASCEHAEDCDSGLCLQTENGKKCSKLCSGTCGNTTDACVQVATQGSDVQFVCVSRSLNLCNPCSMNEDCNFGNTSSNRCIHYGDAGSFCGISCDSLSDDCPKGFTCKFLTDPQSGVGSSQCVPSQGMTCSCSPYAIQKGLGTHCANTNPFGSCPGMRSCKVNGLSSCDSPAPQQEICDGLDNNCDGKTDNIDENNFGVQCTKPNEFGTCIGKFIACSNGKPVCNAPDASPEKCDGLDNNCDGKTDEGLCDDGNGCTADACNTDGSCKHTPLNGTTCDDGNICTSLSLCSAGACKGGTALNCDDNDPCSTDWCDPFTGCQHKPASDATCADDGIACTQDVCKDGKCTHPNWPDGKPCLNDGNVCTDDNCSAGVCVHINNVGPCNDGNICTEKDTCKDGTCSVSTPKNCNDANGCTQDLCDPSTPKGCYSIPANAVVAFCNDDNNPCTTDECVNATCTHKPLPGCK